MIDTSKVQKGQTGFVIHEFKVVPVTVSSIEDIAYHGTPCYKFYYQEINNESFWELYTEKEAYENYYLWKLKVNKPFKKT